MYNCVYNIYIYIYIHVLYVYINIIYNIYVHEYIYILHSFFDACCLSPNDFCLYLEPFLFNVFRFRAALVCTKIVDLQLPEKDSKSTKVLHVPIAQNLYAYCPYIYYIYIIYYIYNINIQQWAGNKQ